MTPSPKAMAAAIAAFNTRRPRRSRLPQCSAAMKRALQAAFRVEFFDGAAYRAGVMLSNCAYNMSQPSFTLNDATRRSLKELQVAWDAATVAWKKATS